VGAEPGAEVLEAAVQLPRRRDVACAAEVIVELLLELEHVAQVLGAREAEAAIHLRRDRLVGTRQRPAPDNPETGIGRRRNLGDSELVEVCRRRWFRAQGELEILRCHAGSPVGQCDVEPAAVDLLAAEELVFVNVTDRETRRELFQQHFDKVDTQSRGILNETQLQKYETLRAEMQQRRNERFKKD